MTYTSFVTDAEELWMTLSDKQYKSVYMNKMDCGIMCLTCKTKDFYILPNNFTSLARLELLKKL